MVKMKKYTYVLIAGLAFFMTSCETEVKEDQSSTDPIHEEHDHANEAIELDNGKKWVVVDEIMGYIKKMEDAVDAVESQDSIDYDVLTSELESNVELLTSNCTMTGKAHDELHKWLLPYLDLVDELSNSKNDQEANAVLREIQTSFVTFNTYFQ